MYVKANAMTYIVMTSTHSDLGCSGEVMYEEEMKCWRCDRAKLKPRPGLDLEPAIMTRGANGVINEYFLGTFV